ncbi:hypothetical protein PCE1_003573 [Barthelona sp. PCE]
MSRNLETGFYMRKRSFWGKRWGSYVILSLLCLVCALAFALVAIPPKNDASYTHFVKKYPDYGYPAHSSGTRLYIDGLRDFQFPMLSGHKAPVYLDFTGSSLAAKSQIDEYGEYLLSNLMGNPHSGFSSEIPKTAHQLLSAFNTDYSAYSVVFTSGATASIKLVGESFDFGENGVFMYTENNHISVTAIRVYAKSSTVVEPQITTIVNTARDISANQPSGTLNLLAFPLESNFNGFRSSVDRLKRLKEELPDNWYVLVDVAASVPHSPLDLSNVIGDFFPMSFYKMFGNPTGSGALVVRKEAIPTLVKTYSGGGTVIWSNTTDVIFRNHFSNRFQDGTPAFDLMPAIRIGLSHLRKLTFDAIHKHTQALSNYLRSHLERYQYSTGMKALYVLDIEPVDADELFDEVGPVVSFIVRNSDGSIRNSREVAEDAAMHNIKVRSGCLCNYGGCNIMRRAFAVEQEEIARVYMNGCKGQTKFCLFRKYWIDSSDRWDPQQYGVPDCGCGEASLDYRYFRFAESQVVDGVVRVSVGYLSDFKDIERFLAWLTNYLNI